MAEFRPPIRLNKARLMLGLLLPLALVVPLGLAGWLVFGMTSGTYAIADGALRVRSGDPLSGSRNIPLTDVIEARVVELGGGVRVAGTALPGYCAGRFRYAGLGTVWQVTDCSGPGILVRARSEALPIVLTPPDPAAFLRALGTGGPLQVVLPPPDAGSVRLVAMFTVPLALLALGMLPVLLLLGPRRMRYLVQDGTLRAETIFGHRSWPVAGAKVRAYTPSALWRMAGTAAPGYYTGRYREAGLGTRVYATDLKQTVLFEGKERVILSPADRGAFLRAMGREGAKIEGEETL
jgi:hypothetical protein